MSQYLLSDLALKYLPRILLRNFPWNLKHPDAVHDLLVLKEERELIQARIMACGDYLLFQGPKPNVDFVTQRPLKLWNWKSGELLVSFNNPDGKSIT